MRQRKTQRRRCSLPYLLLWLLLLTILALLYTLIRLSFAKPASSLNIRHPPAPQQQQQQERQPQVVVQFVKKSSFYPKHPPLQFSPVSSISHLLDSCPVDSALNNEQYQLLLFKKVRQCDAPLSLHDFVCASQCPAVEEELEQSLRLSRVAKYNARYLHKLCSRADVPLLLWIYDNKIKVKVCDPRHFHGKTVFKQVVRLLFILSCQVRLPNVLFGFDNSDFSLPTTRNDYGTNWIQPLPAVLRLVGSPSHPSLLLPTPDFIRKHMFCNIDKEGEKHHWVVHDEEACRSRPLQVQWKDKQPVIFWRGSATGLPIADTFYHYLPRMAAVLKLVDEEHFDLGFVQGIPPTGKQLPAFYSMWTAASKQYVKPEQFASFKYLLHMDGHSASWGLSRKLVSSSAVLWVESLFHYREFYYTLLSPWEHFIPVASDFSDAKSTRDWLLTEEGDAFAEQVVLRVQELFRRRLRTPDVLCYLVRLLYSLAEQQQDPDPSAEVLAAAGFSLRDFVTPDGLRGTEG